nr:hypothetical protein [Candidatus Mycoplasma haematolamae]
MLSLICSGGVVGGASYITDKLGWYPLFYERVPEGQERWLLWRYYKSSGDKLVAQETYLDCAKGGSPILANINEKTVELTCNQNGYVDSTKKDQKLDKSDDLKSKLNIECWYRGRVDERYSRYGSHYFLACDSSLHDLGQDDFSWTKEGNKITLSKKERQVK